LRFHVLSIFAHLDRDQLPVWMPDVMWHDIETNIVTAVEARDMATTGPASANPVIAKQELKGET
jgi:hypothetical protein